MKRLLVVLALTLASLSAHADTVRYVNGMPNGGGVDDSTTGGCHGLTASNPWRTLQFAMKALPQPNTTNGDVILRVAGNGVNKYAAAAWGFGPRKPPINGKRYFIYGNLSNPSLVRIDSSSANNNNHFAAIVCSSQVTVAGFRFLNGVYVHDLGRVQTGSTTSTRWRMRDTLKNCYVDGDMKLLGSNIYVTNTTMSPSTGRININRQRPSADPFAVPGLSAGPTSPRRRSVDVWLNGVTGLFDNGTRSSSEFIGAGCQQVCYTANGGPCVESGSNVNDPQRSLYCDSLHFWFCNITGKVNNTSNTEAKGLALFHCALTNFRGNHWTWNATHTQQSWCHTTRDSIDGTTMDCDTVICKGPLDGSGYNSQLIPWYVNVNKWAGNDRCYALVDSCYFQAGRIQFYSPLAGSFTYTTFVTQFGIQHSDQTIDDFGTPHGVTFNHDTFVATKTKISSVMSFDGFDDWSSSHTDGSNVVFTNNLVVRPDSVVQVGISGISPVIQWGTLSTIDSTKANARKFTADWNLYAAGNMASVPGDNSIGYNSTRSRPGDNGFKTACDAQALGTAAAAASAYDSLGTYCYPASLLIWNWASNTGWNTLFVAGTKLDLEPKVGSPVIGAGSGGSDIGAVAYNAGRVAMLEAIGRQEVFAALRRTNHRRNP
jgi:hypothetical protein